MAQLNDLNIDGANIIFPNFSGTPDQFNKSGKRIFNVVIDNDDDAEQLANDGWAVKIRQGNENYDPYKFIKCELQFMADNPNVRIDPEVYLISERSNGSRSQVKLDANTVGTLDGLFKQRMVKHVDLTLTPYHWKTDLGEGVKAYAKYIYVTADTNVWADKYSDDNTDEVPF